MPDPAAQGAEERWTITVCAECGRRIPDPACTHQGIGTGKWSKVEVVPLSRAQEAEAALESVDTTLGAAGREAAELRARLGAVEGALREWVRNGRWPGDSEVEALADRAALNPERAAESAEEERLYCSVCGEARGTDRYTCREGGESVPKDQAPRGLFESAEGER